MDKPHDPMNVASAAARHEITTKLRRECPVSKTASGAWFIAGREGVEAALRNVWAFTGSFGRQGPDDDVPEERKLIGSIPEPRHGELRRVMNAVLAPHKIAECEQFVRSLCRQLIDGILDDVTARSHDPVDMVTAFADPVPTTVIAHVLGVPTSDNARFGRWTDELLAAMDSDARADRPVHDPTASSPEFMAYLDDQIDQRIRHLDSGGAPGNDIISRYLRAEICGERLSPIAIRSQLVMLIIAGNETTRNLIGNVLYRLASDRDLFESLRRNPAFVPIAIEESLRLDTPVQILARTCVEDADVAGQTIPAGDRIVVGVASANRDEERYDDPAAYRLDRQSPRDHVAFGVGPHVCPGAALARLEGVVAIETVLERCAALTMPPGAQFDANPVFWAHGPRTLPLLIAPANGEGSRRKE